MRMYFNLPHIGDRKSLFLLFTLGFVVRLIPEILSYPYPIGFDTVKNAARIKSGIVWDHWTSVFSTWLLDAILISLYKVVQVDPFLLMKLAAPTLYALNVCGIYYFSRRALDWGVRKALIAALFFTFQLAPLMLSWGLHKNMLGLAILLFTLPLIKNLKPKRMVVLFVLLSMLVVFGHELASVVLFAIVFGGVMVSDFLKGNRVIQYNVLGAILLSMVIFLVGVYLRLFPIPFLSETNVIDIYQPPPRPGGLFFLVNYVDVSFPLGYPTYLHLVSHVFSLFGVLYLLCLPLVFIGFFRDKILDSWTLLLIVGSFNGLITPFVALDFWYRWMYMLIYPFTFYVVTGIEKVLKSKSESVHPDWKWTKWMKVSKRMMLGILLSSILLGFVFMDSIMLENSVPMQDTKGTIETLQWLNKQMNASSSVLAHQAIFHWARLYLDETHMIISFETDVERALSIALENGFNPIYLIWWNENIGWYDIAVPEYFVSQPFSSGRMSVFQYRVTNGG